MGRTVRRQPAAHAGGGLGAAGPGVCPDRPCAAASTAAQGALAALRRAGADGAAFFALSSRPRHTPIDYVSPCGRWWLRAEPAPGHGVVSIRDAELLILIASKLIHKQPQGSAVPEVVDLNPRQLLQARGLTGSGREYALLRASLERLQGTRYTTNIRPDGGFGAEQTFALIEEVTFANSRGHLELRLSDWFRTAVGERHVLQLCEAYLDIPGNYERWLYRVVRKHVGEQPYFQMSVSTLWEKSGKGSPLPRFKHELRKVVQTNDLPDYGVWWLLREGQEPLVTMGPREGARRKRPRTEMPDAALGEWK
ncbi:replication initiator protein A [Methylobacterium sp. BE186]|uniref:replication initiator protein A n=1 Tax=Methylobacterium sp. BE186 TaxID=2817715 RepID=UPI00286D4069|nr:replication initiator protein A [Methylobacterium sp. BE186]